VRERIGSYRIERVLAQGGMGLVYKGRHETLGRDAAIKTLLPKSAGDASLRQRLLREAQAQARLQHQNVVTVYDLIDDHDELFIAMEFVEGETLAALLDRAPRGRLTLEEALPIFDQVLDALEYVHGEKIIHRDVKPSNVMVCGSRVKLADFGIALLSDEPRMTASLQLLGSLPYMSPEQLQAKSLDRRTDIYSAALVLYRMVAGCQAFRAQEYLAQVHERMAGPPALRMLVPELPIGVCDAVGIALRHEPAERFHAAATFAEALREGAAGFFVSAPQPIDNEAPTEVLADAVVEPPPRKPAVVAGFAIAGGLAAAAFVIHDRLGEQSFPAAAPVSTKAIIESSIAPPVIVDRPAPPVQPPLEPRRSEPAKTSPFVPPERTPVDDGAAKRRELDELREAIRTGLTRAETDLGFERFDVALEELDRIAALAQRRPEELAEDRRQIAGLRSRVTVARVAAETRKAEDALWASRLADIEEDLRAERWPEAERFAKNIGDDPRAPEQVATRARALLQLAKEGRRNAFKDTQVGPNTNTIRKPSSPPRNER